MCARKKNVSFEIAQLLFKKNFFCLMVDDGRSLSSVETVEDCFNDGRGWDFFRINEV